MQLITSYNNWLRGFLLLPDLCGVVLINHIDPLVVLTVFVMMFDSIETFPQDLNIDLIKILTFHHIYRPVLNRNIIISMPMATPVYRLELTATLVNFFPQ